MKVIKIQIYSNNLIETNKKYMDQLQTELEKGDIIGYSIGVVKE